MFFRTALLIYHLVLPVFCLVAAPFWLLKMVRRGGWGSGLLERVGVYDCDPEVEKQGAVYVHAVSVGEVLLALKLMEAWRKETGDHFILAPTTATGMAVAREKAPDFVRVIYAPIDLSFLIRRVLNRFDPRAVILIESELWPNLIVQTNRLGIPLGLANARLSPRSGKRLRALRALVAPLLTRFDRIGLPEEADRERWRRIGARDESLVVTGSVKFDPQGAAPPSQRADFGEMLDAFGAGRKIVMAVSTFPEEDEWLAQAFLSLGDHVVPVIVPRHAERRATASQAITETTGREVILRSRFRKPHGREVFLIDSTGELRDWTAHADVVVIGKSFFEKGGQNPAEAIQAGIPVICGPHMANFEPLISELQAAQAIWSVEGDEGLAVALREALRDSAEKPRRALEVLKKHEGAVARTIALF